MSLIFGDKILIFGERFLIFGERFLIFGDKVLIFGERFLILGDKVLIFGEECLVHVQRTTLYLRRKPFISQLRLLLQKTLYTYRTNRTTQNKLLIYLKKGEIGGKKSVGPGSC